jgi:hypothetical protein
LAGQFSGSVWQVNSAGQLEKREQVKENSGSERKVKVIAKRVNVHLILCRPVTLHHVDAVSKVLFIVLFCIYIPVSPEPPKWIFCELLM